MVSTYTWICAHCGATFERINKGHPFRFCSRSCSASYRRLPDGSPMNPRTRYERLRKSGYRVKRYPFNHDFFYTWTDDLAWLLGIIWSDGNLSRHTVNIVSKDRDLIETVCSLIEQPNGVRQRKDSGAWETRFSNINVAQFLRDIGLVEAKSLVACWPLIPAEHEAAFVRGLLDGDGSVLYCTMRQHQQVPDLYVQFCGAAPLLMHALSEWLDKHEVKHRMYHRKRLWKGKDSPLLIIQVLRISAQRALHSILYPSDTVPALSRKKATYDEWMAIPRPGYGRPLKERTKRRDYARQYTANKRAKARELLAMDAE